MEPFEDEFMTNFSVRVVVGRRGMGPNSEVMKKFGAVYYAFTGGTVVLSAECMHAALIDIHKAS